MTNPTCKKCSVEMHDGTALANTLSWSDDFGSKSKEKTPPRGVTCSYGGESVLVAVWKCPECGHSFSRGMES